ncbi:glycosyltransferase [Rubrivirga sp. S365]|uniref:glycosyltransferase family 8 protein n=1 Tax=Rubrivirga sp. S365 TaxID=3076080 RepID=UPI0028C5F410|nr:glycosyltransferase [Rubrivirga sp. S365]MDT7856835.1 glycosyltransferase [Rubrivirga sp. S365]
MHVVCATDDGFALPTAVMAASLAAASDPGRRLALHVLDGGLSPAVAGRLDRALGHTAAQAAARGVTLDVHRVAPDLSAIAGLGGNSRITATAYLRLLAPDILGDVGRAVWFDGDVLVFRDPGALLDVSLRDPTGRPSPAAAAPNTGSPVGRGRRSYAERGLDPFLPYNNSGVMVMDFSRWRAEQLGQAVIAELREYGHLYKTVDQCGLNAVLSAAAGGSRWAPLPGEWNVQAGSHVTRAAPPAVSVIAALHFTTGRKPWSHKYLTRSGQGPTFAIYQAEWFRAAQWSGWFSEAEWARWRIQLATRRVWAKGHQTLSQVRSAFYRRKK